MNDAQGLALLDLINDPAVLRALPHAALAQLADELRAELIAVLAERGGHFAAGLGVIELTIALHRCFNTPDDRLIWDIGHQAYPHKMLTGRLDRLETIRRRGGLAPFLSRDESPYDAFGAGHAGTALSAAAGFAAAARQLGSERRVVAIVGDGGLTAGMSFEALNHIGDQRLDVLTVYNDNDWSISENVGALRERSAQTLARLGFAAPHEQRPVADEDGAPPLAAFFESLGCAYYGPVDGHDLDALIDAFEALRDVPGPRLLHVVTVKGKGYAPAEADPTGYHGVGRFDPATGAQPPSAAAPTYSQIFGDWLCAAAEVDPRIVAITPAMREGSGLVEFAQRYPERYHDVGIAEQHAVTFAAGLAAEGLRPVVAIYSTFLQRGYDSLLHDVALQNLPVLFAIDRGGLVGADGATHHGAYDLSFLRCVPNLTIMAPSDENECQRLLTTALTLPGPSAVRYPRGTGPGAALDAAAEPLPVGRGRVLRRGSSGIALLAFGAPVAAALQAAETLDATVADLRYVKPLDGALIAELATTHQRLVTIEDNAIAGGAGSAVNEWLAAHGIQTPIRNLGLPEQPVSHGGRDDLLADCGLDAAGLVAAIQKL